MGKKISIISTSCVSSVAMVLYVSMACFNLYGLMYPLRYIDLTTIPEENFVNPLWEKEELMHMKVYLSEKENFDRTFIESEFLEEPENVGDTMFLWKEDIRKPSVSKSFLVTSLKCDQELCATEEDLSTKQAVSWLDQADKQLLVEDGDGILSTISSAGQGIESTSILLTLYESMTRQLLSLLAKLSLVEEPKQSDEPSTDKGVLERSKIHLPPESQMWKALTSNNSTLYVHVVVVRQKYNGAGAENANEAAMALSQASRTHSLLLGQVGLVKHEIPHHVNKPGRILYNDIVYFFRKYLRKDNSPFPPWEMQENKPEAYAAYQKAQQMKEEKEGYPYFKPEVAVKYLVRVRLLEIYLYYLAN
jgi:hypothetical protein